VTSHPFVQTELPGSVRLEPGDGDLPRLGVGSRTGEAEIYLHGAHLTSWTPAGHAPVIWLSRASTFTSEVAIRGGVPICFPWFGPHAVDSQAPSHGFARLANWTVTDARETGDDVSLVFRLTDSGRTRASAWPYRFEAAYRVTVGAALSLSLQVTNWDTRPVAYEAALHTYYAVGDVREVTVTGLENTAYLDQLAGPEPQRQGPEPVRFTGETDRIYTDTAATATIEDPGQRRAVSIHKDGSETTVVWNPWSGKAHSMKDFGDDEWTGMVCVETCNVGEAAIRLEPGAQHTMTATIEVASLG